MATSGPQHDSLLDALGPAPTPEDKSFRDTAWVEVVRKMDEVYTDLIRYEVDLEEKNARLEEAQAFISSVLSSMSDILIVCDTRGRVQEVNAAVSALTGFSADDLVGRPLSGLLDREGMALQGRLCAAVKSRDSIQDCEVRFDTKAGAVSDLVAVNCSPRHDHDGRPAGFVLIGRPVGELRRAYDALNRAHAELKQAQQQLVQQEKMASLGRLVAGVAHELNNPISFIYGNLFALKRDAERLTRYLDAVHAPDVPAGERAQLRKELKVDALLADLTPLVDGTMEGATRLADIIKNLRRLSFTRGGTPQEVDLSRIIHTALQWTAKGARSSPALDIRVPEGLSVHGDEGQIHQVMVNLAQNAVDAVADRPDGRIVVEASDDGEAVRVVVSDNGPGIAETDLLRVFDPFFTTKEVGEGTGLGLWISYGIVRDHGGSFEAANAPGGGARFTFVLPKGGSSPPLRGEADS